MTDRPYTAAGAEIDGAYRYKLWREWDCDLPACTWIMLNPSTADAEEDDPTIRKCVGFAKRWNCGRIEVVNLFALRATNPRELYSHTDPVGPRNNEAIRLATYNAEMVVCAWGTHGGLNRRGDDVLGIISAFCVPLALKRTKSDQPGHPLYIPYERDLFLWSERFERSRIAP